MRAPVGFFLFLFDGVFSKGNALDHLAWCCNLASQTMCFLWLWWTIPYAIVFLKTPPRARPATAFQCFALASTMAEQRPDAVHTSHSKLAPHHKGLSVCVSEAPLWLVPHRTCHWRFIPEWHLISWDPCLKVGPHMITCRGLRPHVLLCNWFWSRSREKTRGEVLLTLLRNGLSRGVCMSVRSRWASQQ